MHFGDLFQFLRLRLNMTLREFCEENGFDPGNISKLERGILPPPHSAEKLEVYAKALKIKAGDEEYMDFFDLAAISNANFPIKKIADKGLIKKLPALFRTVDNKKLTEKKLNRILKLVEKEIKK